MAEGEGRLVAGRYRLRRSLGQGGMGVVWLAYDEYLHREVAVKEILPRGRELRDTDPEVRRALREARAAAKLSKHPGIITVHDVVTDDTGLPWIVMELLHGQSLRTALETDGPMPVDQAARIGAQVLAALDYAHGQGVLHRDVKPGNVMLFEDQAVLTDFGIAVLDGVSVLTATGQIPGSPEYVAPERIRGEETSPAADLWSVGVMLYTMVVGRGPFQRPDIQAMMGAALTLNPDPNPRVGRLAPVVEGLLRKNPTERMTAKQAIAALAQLAAVAPGQLTTAETPAPGSPPLPAAQVPPDAPTLDPESTFDPAPNKPLDPASPHAPGRTLDPASHSAPPHAPANTPNTSPLIPGRTLDPPSPHGHASPQAPAAPPASGPPQDPSPTLNPPSPQSPGSPLNPASALDPPSPQSPASPQAPAAPSGSGSPQGPSPTLNPASPQSPASALDPASPHGHASPQAPAAPPDSGPPQGFSPPLNPASPQSPASSSRSPTPPRISTPPFNLTPSRESVAPRLRRGPMVVAGAVLVVVAVVVAIVLANRGGDEGAAVPTTTTDSSRVPLEPHQDPLGFEIDIPRGWQRNASPTEGPISDVIWEGPQTEPTVGALKVQVRRDTTVSGVSAYTYLTEEDETQSQNPDRPEYATLALDDRGESADLEYTYRAVAGSPYFHVRVRAFARGGVYTLTFSTSASDAATLQEQWRDAAPLFDEIRDSFRVM